jgi:hypothetical protein
MMLIIIFPYSLYDMMWNNYNFLSLMFLLILSIIIYFIVFNHIYYIQATTSEIIILLKEDEIIVVVLFSFRGREWRQGFSSINRASIKYNVLN